MSPSYLEQIKFQALTENADRYLACADVHTCTADGYTVYLPRGSGLFAIKFIFRQIPLQQRLKQRPVVGCIFDLRVKLRRPVQQGRVKGQPAFAGATGLFSFHGP